MLKDNKDYSLLVKNIKRVWSRGSKPKGQPKPKPKGPLPKPEWPEQKQKGPDPKLELLESETQGEARFAAIFSRLVNTIDRLKICTKAPKSV